MDDELCQLIEVFSRLPMQGCIGVDRSIVAFYLGIAGVGRRK